MEYPVIATKDGVNFKPEKMEREKLYHCIFKDKLMLVFKDSQDLLSCYEVDDIKIVEMVKKCTSSADLEETLQDYMKATRIIK